MSRLSMFIGLFMTICAVCQGADTATLSLRDGTSVERATFKGGRTFQTWTIPYVRALGEIRRSTPKSEYPNMKLGEIDRIDFKELTKAERDQIYSEGSSCMDTWCLWRKGDVFRRDGSVLRNVFLEANFFTFAGPEGQEYNLVYFRFVAVRLNH